MRTTLLATTILAGSALLPAGQAAADGGPIQIGLSGFIQAYAGWASQDRGAGPDGITGTADDAPGAGRRSTGFYRKSRIYFDGDTLLDNGLKVGVEIHLNTEDCTDMIDQSFVWFEHSLGRLQYGKSHSAAYLMAFGAPTPADGLGLNTPNFIPVNSENLAGNGNMIPTPTTFVGTPVYETLTYFTPRIAGIQLGLSYSPNPCQAGNSGGDPCGGSYGGMYPSKLPELYDLFSVAANYVNTFNGVDVGIYGGYYHGSNGVSKGAPGTPTEDLSQWGVGASVGYAGFTLGAAYRHTDGTEGIVGASGHDWNAGINYATGPWSVGFQYAQSEAKLMGRTDDFKGGSLGSMYTLGPGIRLSAAVQYFNWGTNATNPAVSTPATNKAWNVMLGTSIDF